MRFSFFITDYECYEEGSVFGYQNDPTTGNCTCKDAWQGYKCRGMTEMIPTVACKETRHLGILPYKMTIF